MTKQEKLLKPTPQQVKNRNRGWATSLFGNKRKAREQMKNSHGGRCCLQVAQDHAISCGLELSRKDILDTVDTGLPPNKVAMFYGWDDTDPRLVLPGDPDSSIYSSCINDGVFDEYNKFDGKGLPHSKIAECVLNTFVHPSKKKWSFKL